MTKQNVLQALYAEPKSPLEFNFDILTAPPLLSLLTPYDIMELNQIARSVKLSSKIDEKYRLIDNIMRRRGFVKLHAGTNRVVYRFSEDQRFVIKVAVDRVGLGDNPAEYRNQFLLKPFVTKVFEVSPCGTCGIFERVDPIRSREEFMSVADDIFNLITKVFVGKYILEDIGTWYFLNWGLRKSNGIGFGPVLLDFPYVYELDGNKLYCNKPLIPGRPDTICGGQLDYDAGFNNLVCTRCGKHYQARDLSKKGKEQLIIVGGKKKMRVQVKIGNDIILDSGKSQVAKVIEPPKEIQKTITKEAEKLAVKEYSDFIKSSNEDINKAANKVISDEVSEGLTVLDKNMKETTVFEEAVKEQPKTKKVESNKKTYSTKKTTPSAGIFNKKKIEPVKEEKAYEDMYDELDDVLDQYSDDSFDDDYSEYDEYLNNRQRSNIRNASKPKKKRRSDFGDF